MQGGIDVLFDARNSCRSRWQASRIIRIER
jgi:hypothetical protein